MSQKAEGRLTSFLFLVLCSHLPKLDIVALNVNFVKKCALRHYLWAISLKFCTDADIGVNM